MFGWSSEAFQLRAIAVVIVLFVISAYFSYQSARYAIFGKTVQAEVLKVQEVRARRSYQLVVTYTFTDDDGQVRTEVDNAAAQLSNMSPEPADDAPWLTPVRYIPNSPGSSRLPKSNDWIFISIFSVMCLVVVWFGVFFWRDYSKHAKRMAESR